MLLSYSTGVGTDGPLTGVVLEIGGARWTLGELEHRSASWSGAATYYYRATTDARTVRDTCGRRRKVDDGCRVIVSTGCDLAGPRAIVEHDARDWQTEEIRIPD